MDELKIINQQEVLGKDFKIYGDFENPLFLAKDVAEWIDNKQPTQMVETVDDEEKLKCFLNTSGQNREMWFLTENGLYEVLMQSRKPIAKQFKKQVKAILKDIRTHGMYATDELLDNPDLLIKLATQLKTEREEKKKLESKVAVQNQQITELQPKASYYDLVLNCKDLISTSTIAKDYGMSAIELNKYLHAKGVQFKQGGIWLLYQKHAEQGYTSTKTQPINGNDGEIHTKVHTYWTQKGRLFIYGLLKADGVVPLIERYAEEDCGEQVAIEEII